MSNSTDVLFTDRAALKSLYPRLISHGLQCFGAKEVMGFLGRKLTGHFQGELITDLLDLWHERIPGMRIKHRVKENWIKMYDKVGRVLRIETVINNPNHFRVRKSVRRQGQSTTEWVPLRKGVAYLFRYRDISHSANSRYLDALTVVSDPKRESAKVSRILHRFHAHGLVAKYPHSRRWRTTRLGRRMMATAIQVRKLNFPQLLALAP